MTFTKETYADYKILRDMLVIGVDTNTLVAQAVFGFYKMNGQWLSSSPDDQYAIVELKLPDYSNNLSDAFRVVNLCQVFSIDLLRNGNWYCELRLSDGDSIHFANGTIEMAVCRAALRAAEEKYLKEEQE